MRKPALTLLLALSSLTMAAADYDLGEPFGFCTRSSRTDASKTYNVTGGGAYTYPLPEGFTGTSIVLKSTGLDMKGTIQNAIKQYDVVILDGSNGDFIVSENIGFERGNKTILGINNARLCTQWYITDEIRQALNNAGVLSKSTSSGTGGTLSNGTSVSEERELVTRQTIINTTGDSQESYRKSGIFSLNKQNVIIRNITFVGPGSVDVGGYDLISATGAKNCWVDHCTFQDGMDGNFDITQSSDFMTVSWCIFRYTSRSYDHMNTNLVGSSDSEATGFLNTTFAFNWWSTGCKQRMPMARVGKIHMLNNYYSCTGSSNCINPRKNSEFLIEGNYFTSGVNNFYSQSDAKAVTWASSNYHASKSIPSSMGNTVTVPYTYTVATASSVPDAVQANAGATLPWGDSGSSEQTGTKGSINWALSSNTNAEVSNAIATYVTDSQVNYGSNLSISGYGTYGNVRFAKFTATAVESAAKESNAVRFSFTTNSGEKFKATSVSFQACKIGTDNGTFDAHWVDGGGSQELETGVVPNRNDAGGGYYSTHEYNLANRATETGGTCTLLLNLYNVGFIKDGTTTQKELGLANVIISGTITTAAGIATPVTIGLPVSTEYYTPDGRRLAAPQHGLNIRVQRMADGHAVTTKILF